GPVRARGRLSGVSGPPAVAGGIQVSAVWAYEGLGGAEGALSVRRLWATDLGDGRHDLSGHAYAVDDLVSRALVDQQSEDRHERQGPPAGFGAGQLRDGMDLAAQSTTGDGAPGPRPADGPCGSGRGVSGRRRGGAARASDREESVDCGGR